MVDKTRKHRSHVSAKEARTRGWRKVPKKGTGRRTMLKGVPGTAIERRTKRN